MHQLLLYCSLFFCNIVNAQKEFSLNHYTVEEGLSDNTTRSILQDDRGFIWISTANGLNRFDGVNFKKFYSTGLAKDLPDNNIREIKRWKNDYLLLGTFKGVGVFNVQTGECKKITLPALQELSSQTNIVGPVAVTTKDQIVVGSTTGIFVYDEKLKLVTSLEGYTSEDIGKKWLRFSGHIEVLSNGDALISTIEGFYIYSYERKKIIPLAKADRFYEKLKPFNKICNTCVFTINNKDEVCIIDYNSKKDVIHLLDLKNDRMTVSLLPFRVINNIGWWTSMRIFGDTMLVISIAAGIHCYAFNPVTLQLHFLKKQPFPGATISDFLFDQQDRFWIASDNGIYAQSFVKSRFQQKHLPVTGANSYPIQSVYRFSNKYFIAASNPNNNLLVLDTNFTLLKQINFQNLGGECNNNWSIEHWSKDTLIIGTQQGALLLNVTDHWFGRLLYKNLPHVINEAPITITFKDSHEIYWVGLGRTNGVLAFDTRHHQCTHFLPRAPGANFKLRYPGAIAEDKLGNIWMCHAQEGLTRWNYQAQRFDTLIKKFDGFIANENDFCGLATDSQGNLWISFITGEIAKWNLINNRIEHLRINDMPEGMNALSGAIPGQVWVKCHNSVLVIDINTATTKTLNKATGLPANSETGNNFYYDTVSKNLVLGYENSVCMFNLYNIFPKEEPKKLFITEVNVLNDSVKVDPTKTIRLKYFRNDVNIQFSAIDFETGMNNEYEYRLFEDSNTRWINIGKQSFVTLNNLSPGNHVFHVRMVSQYPEQQNMIASLNIIIIPPFYETWWFYMLTVITMALIIYSLYQYRMKQLLQLQQVRNRISGDLHDDIGSRLTNIQMLSALGEQKLEEKEKATFYLHRIVDEVQGSGEALDDIVWSINSKNDSGIELSARMRRYASEVFEGDAIAYTMKVSDTILQSTFLMEKRRDIYLIFKEAVNNIHKHADATEVSINLFTDSNQFVLTVTDNGRGFEVSAPSARNGLKNMKTRVEKWNGKISIESVPGNGSKLSAFIPLKNSSYKKRIWGWF